MARYAYAARYGHQPLSELRRLSIGDLDAFIAALGDIVQREEGKGDDDG